MKNLLILLALATPIFSQETFKTINNTKWQSIEDRTNTYNILDVNTSSMTISKYKDAVRIHSKTYKIVNYQNVGNLIFIYFEGSVYPDVFEVNYRTMTIHGFDGKLMIPKSYIQLKK